MADYFDLHRIVSLILLIIPLTCWVLGFVTRFKEQKYVAGIVRIFFGYIIWILDIIMTVINGCRVNIARFINC